MVTRRNRVGEAASAFENALNRPRAVVQAEWNFMSTFDEGAFALWESATEQTASDQLYDLNIRQMRTHWAPSLALAWPSGWRLETATALSVRARSATGVASNQPYDAPFETWGVLPRLGISKDVGGWGHWFAQASTGFSDPTNFESLATDADGALPTPLRAEQALTVETGLRHAQAELVFYHQTVGNAIVQVVEDEAEMFINEGDPLTMAGKPHQPPFRTPRLACHGSAANACARPIASTGAPNQAATARLPKWTATIHTWHLWQREHQWRLCRIRVVGETP